MEIFIITTIPFIVSFGWTKLWTATYSPHKISGFIKHTVFFIFMSLMLLLLVKFLIFAPADETYSASNIGALGLLYLFCSSVFGLACLITVIYNLIRCLRKQSEYKQNQAEKIDV